MFLDAQQTVDVLKNAFIGGPIDPLPDPFEVAGAQSAFGPLGANFENDDWWTGPDVKNLKQAGSLTQMQQSLETNPATAQQFKSAEQTGEPGAAQVNQTFRGWQGTHHNGEIPLDALEKVQDDYLRPDVAEAAKAMIRDAKKDGVSLRIVSGYRSRAEQANLYDHRDANPYPVAAPGTSNHGWGTAADWNVHDAGVAEWMARHAGKYGFAEDVAGDEVHFDWTGEYNGKVDAFRRPRRKPRRRKPQDLAGINLGTTEVFSAVNAMPNSVLSILGPQLMDRKPTQARPHHLDASGVPSFVPKKYRQWIVQAAHRYGVSPRLIAYVGKEESRWRPDLTSTAGAQGLLQAMPFWSDDAGDPLGAFDAVHNERKNIFLGAAILAHYLQMARGNVHLGLQYYNAGPGNPDAGQVYADEILGMMRAA